MSFWLISLRFAFRHFLLRNSLFPVRNSNVGLFVVDLMLFPRVPISLSLPMVAMLACGCGDDGRHPTYRTEGTVTLSNGEPLSGGWIEFQLADDARAPSAKARIQPDGHFELGTYDEADGAVEGLHQVLVLPAFPPIADPRQANASPPDPKLYPEINARYRSYETSGLKFSVTSEPSKNRFDIRLEN